MVLVQGSVQAAADEAASHALAAGFDVVTAALLALLGIAIAYGLTLKHRLEQQLADRLEIEGRLRRSEAEYRALIETAPFPIVMTRVADNTLVFANRRMLEQAGAEAGQLLGKPAASYYENPADRQRLFSILLETGSVSDFETCLRLPHGAPFWVYVSAAFSRFNGEEVVFVAFNDITSRKETERRLENSRRHLSAIFDNAVVGISLATPDGRYLEANAHWCRMLGYQAEEIHGLDNLAITYPDDVASSRQHLAALVAGELPSYTSDKRYVRKDGSVFWTTMSAAAIRDAQGAIESVVCVIQDINERNELAIAMRAVNDHLMERLGEIQSLQEQLREQAIRDVLTGLFNRRYLDEVFERELARAMREGHPLTVMMLDLDHFKKLNDTYGHQAGDEVLKALGNMLRKNARTEDIPCRYGGEEFLLLLPNMSLPDACMRAEQLREKFESMHIVFGQFSMAGTLSIGIATFPGHGRTRDELIEGADQALYTAKHNGRNRVEVCPERD